MKTHQFKTGKLTGQCVSMACRDQDGKQKIRVFDIGRIVYDESNPEDSCYEALDMETGKQSHFKQLVLDKLFDTKKLTMKPMFYKGDMMGRAKLHNIHGNKKRMKK